MERKTEYFDSFAGIDGETLVYLRGSFVIDSLVSSDFESELKKVIEKYRI